MLFGLLITVFAINSLLLMLLILVQKGKSSMGLGNLGGGTQMLFGGSGGQDLFQKVTWVMGTIFLAGSLILALMKANEFQKSRYLTNYQGTVQTEQFPSVPVQPSLPSK